MKKIYLLGILSVFLLNSCSLYFGGENIRGKDVDVSFNDGVNIEVNGGVLKDLGDYKIYNFEDNKKCEYYAFKDGLCPKGGYKITGYENDKEIFCRITGGEVIAGIDKCSFNEEEKTLDQFYTEYIKEKYNKIVGIYFDESDKKWKDNYGVCHTCTPENGFSLDGKIFEPGIKNSNNVKECNGSGEIEQCEIYN